MYGYVDGFDHDVKACSKHMEQFLPQLTKNLILLTFTIKYQAISIKIRDEKSQKSRKV